MAMVKSSAVKKSRRKSQREAARIQRQTDAALAMEEEEEIVFKRLRTVPNTPRASRDNTPDPDDREEEPKDFTAVLQMVKTVRDQLTALVLDNTNIRAACDDLRRQCHSQGVAFGDLSRLVSQAREDQEETRAYSHGETGPHPRIRQELLDARGNLRAQDIGISWQDGETFLHGVRITGQNDDMEDNRRQPATAAPHPPCHEDQDSFRISALQKEDPVCVTLHDWVVANDFPAWAEVKSMLPELRSLWHHRNNLSVDDNGTLWRKRSSQSAQLQLLVPKAGRERLFLSYHASLFGGHLGRTRTLARLADRFYWTGMADDVKDWLSQCVACIKRKSPVGRHHPLGNIPTGHRWDRIAMDILDVCDPTPAGFRYILVIADYFSKWTEAFPMKSKCADTVADILVENIILRFGMPLVIHSDQGREFENGLMKSLCALLGCTKTRTAPYHPESDGMIERFNRTCLMMLSMFVNDRRDNWNELLPFIMHAYRTSVHESTGYSPFRLMMGEECSLPQDVSTAELRT